MTAEGHLVVHTSGAASARPNNQVWERGGMSVLIRRTKPICRRGGENHVLRRWGWRNHRSVSGCVQAYRWLFSTRRYCCILASWSSIVSKLQHRAKPRRRCPAYTSAKYISNVRWVGGSLDFANEQSGRAHAYGSSICHKEVDARSVSCQLTVAAPYVCSSAVVTRPRRFLHSCILQVN